MKYSSLENIWTVDVSVLPNADRGRVYYERAKIIINDTFSDPVELEKARIGKRFSRTYLVNKIGCQRGVVTQNPNIRRMLIEVDKRVSLLLIENDV